MKQFIIAFGEKAQTIPLMYLVVKDSIVNLVLLSFSISYCLYNNISIFK